MRSRCPGSMLAWILNTKPARAGSVGSTSRVVAPRGRGGGACATKEPSSSSTPKFDDRRAEEHRRLASGEVGAGIEGRHRPADQLDFLAERRRVLAQECRGLRARQAVDRPVRADAAALAAAVGVNAVFAEVVDARQLTPHADRPGDRRALDAEHALDLVEQLDRRTPVAVELVDEGHDRRVAQPADFHQLDRALLDAFRAVDDHQRRVHRREGRGRCPPKSPRGPACRAG